MGECGRVWASLDEFERVWASLNELRRVETSLEARLGKIRRD